jgi:hypothetical protein
VGLLFLIRWISLRHKHGTCHINSVTVHVSMLCMFNDTFFCQCQTYYSSSLFLLKLRGMVKKDPWTSEAYVVRNAKAYNHIWQRTDTMLHFGHTSFSHTQDSLTSYRSWQKVNLHCSLVHSLLCEERSILLLACNFTRITDQCRIYWSAHPVSGI